MSKQRLLTRISSIIKQSLTGLRSQAGQIDLVADSDTNHLFAIKSDGGQVDLEGGGSTPALVAIAGAAGKRIIATLPANVVIDTGTFLCPAANLLPNDDAVKVKLQIQRGLSYTDITTVETLESINSNKKVVKEAEVFQTQAGDVLVLDVSGGTVTAGTLYVAFPYYSLS